MYSLEQLNLIIKHAGLNISSDKIEQIQLPTSQVRLAWSWNWAEDKRGSYDRRLDILLVAQCGSEEGGDSYRLIGVSTCARELYMAASPMAPSTSRRMSANLKRFIEPSADQSYYVIKKEAFCQHLKRLDSKYCSLPPQAFQAIEYKINRKGTEIAGVDILPAQNKALASAKNKRAIEKQENELAPEKKRQKTDSLAKKPTFFSLNEAVREALGWECELRPRRNVSYS